MPPKQNDADLKTDIADIKSSLEFICKSVDELKKSNGVRGRSQLSTFMKAYREYAF